MKNKGVIIELTALLDVILIMLFWVMINLKDQNENVKNEAETRIAEVQAENDELKDENSRLNEKYAQLEEKYSQLKDTVEKSGSEAVENQTALNDFGNGTVLTLFFEYDESLSDKEAKETALIIRCGSRELEKVDFSAAEITQEELAENIVSAIQKAGYGSDDTILCTFIYNGFKVRYDSRELVRDAIEQAEKSYRNIYCADIDIFIN